VGSGGFWGKGFRNGSQNQLGYIPSGIRISSCRRGLKNRDLRACFWLWAVYGASAAFGAECSTRERSRGNVSGHGRRSGAWVPCTGKRGNGDRRYAGNRHPLPLMSYGVPPRCLFPGDWPGDECPASPLRQLTKPPVRCDVSASAERTGEEIDLLIPAPRVASKKEFRVRTASSADRPARFRRRTSLDRLRNVFLTVAAKRPTPLASNAKPFPYKCGQRASRHSRERRRFLELRRAKARGDASCRSRPSRGRTEG